MVIGNYYMKSFENQFYQIVKNPKRNLNQSERICHINFEYTIRLFEILIYLPLKDQFKGKRPI